MLTLRFDMRAPTFGAPTVELYGAAIEMSRWADGHGALAVVLSEHHGTDDGHLPAPLMLGAAIAACTVNVSVVLAAVVVPFWDPVRLAEEIAVLDIISGGRAMFVLGVGHRVEEYEHFGLDHHQRGTLADTKVQLLLDLLSHEVVEHDGRQIRVTPRPLRPGGPPILIGGGSVAAAERAGRFGLGILGQADAPGLRATYEAACARHGHRPGHLQLPNPDEPTTVFVAEDPERAWAELGPHLLHDAVTAASYRHDDTGVASISRAETVEQLRMTGSPYRVYSVSEATAVIRRGGRLPLLPLCGGLPPDLAWPYLEDAARAVAAADEPTEQADHP